MDEKPLKQEPQWPDAPDVVGKAFLIFFGAALPVGLLILDPIIFRGYPCQGFLAAYGALVYYAVAFGIIALLVWLFTDIKTHDAAAFFAGALLMGRFFAIATGVLMLPFSVLGLIIGIGLLGFLPFLIAIVYHKTGVRAHKIAKLTATDKRRTAAWMLAGVLVVVAIPALIQVGASAAIKQSVTKLVFNQNPGGVATASVELRTINLYCLGLCGSNISAAVAPYGSYYDQDSYRTQVMERVIGPEARPACYSFLTGGGD